MPPLVKVVGHLLQSSWSQGFWMIRSRMLYLEVTSWNIALAQLLFQGVKTFIPERERFQGFLFKPFNSPQGQRGLLPHTGSNGCQHLSLFTKNLHGTSQVGYCIPPSQRLLDLCGHPKCLISCSPHIKTTSYVAMGTQPFP